MRKFGASAIVMAAMAGFSPSAALACACGCAVFDVGTSSLLPNGPGATIFGEYDFLNQTKNWSGTSSAPAADNDDKNIRSDFYLAGGQYMFNDDWGVMAELPYTERHFATEVSPGTVGDFDHGSLGDIRLMGVYSGFSPDMSTGITFGVKLPTGDHTYPNFDQDTEIGSGSTDILLGGYHSGQIDFAGDFVWYSQVLWQHHVATQDGYTPGPELNGAIGISYNNWNLSSHATLAPVLQLLVSERGRDGGPAADPDNSGYQRLLLSPGLSLSVNQWKLYADVEVPVWQHMNGNQLIAPYALKFIASYSL
ncbi:MAG: hypothetical protein WBQ17_07560 [Rhizomicrobium sp.]